MKILFIGNSYTYFNDMPEMVGKLMRENGIKGEVFSVTKGARKLMQNVDERDAITEKLDALLEDHRFDAAFLQEQSLLPLLNYEKFRYGVSALVKKLDSRAKRIILYATWGRKEGSPQLEENHWTSEGMTRSLAEAYGKLGHELEIEVSYVGLAFAKLYPSREDIELYMPDCSHSTVVGSALAAIVHYKKLFGGLPNQTASLGLEPSVVEALLGAAALVD